MGLMQGKLLATLIPGRDIEEVEIMRHRFETLEQDMRNQEAKVRHFILYRCKSN